MQILARRSPNASRVERWLGKEKAEYLSYQFRDWYGPPVNIRDVPGSLWIGPGGDFVGDFRRGAGHSALDAFADHFREFRKRLDRERRFGELVFGSGFTSISDALAKASGGDSRLFANWNKAGTTGVVGAANSLWAVGATPAAGANGSAAPGGREPDSTTTGAFPFTNVSAGTLRLTGADFMASVVNNALLLYDRIFDVAKTMNSTGTEAVSGVPGRYQNTTGGTEDYAGGNFLFMECTTVLAAVAHNWTVCTYTDESGNAGANLPSVTGNSANIVNRLDMPANQWFAPLATGDIGIKALTQMQCSALVTSGAINFVIAHPIGIMSFPVASSVLPYDWLTNRNLAPRIFDSACLAFLELPKPATNATTYAGSLYATRAA